MFTESRFLEILNELVGPPPAGVGVGVGDDAAVLSIESDAVIAADMILDGVDFVLSECGYRATAIKALRKNVSDLAAMGARPTASFVSVALPAAMGETEARELLVGLVGEARRLGCPVLGGDTKRSSGSLVLAVTMIGCMEGRAPVTRSGAQPGDVLMVSGPLGGSLRGRHLNPPVRIDLGVAASEFGVHAMIDLSDGLSKDLSRICDASSVGAVVESAAVPIHPDAESMARTSERTALEHALHDGEDFELLLAAPSAAIERMEERTGLTGRCHRIGRVVSVELGITLESDGARTSMSIDGFEHRFDGAMNGGEVDS